MKKAFECPGAAPAIIAAIFVIHGAAYGGAPVREDAPLSSGEAGRQILEFVSGAEAAGFSGAVLAARRGQVVAAGGAGFADLAGKQPVTPVTLFEIASASKPITACAVMRLVQDRRIGLDDGISRWIKGIPTSCRAITVRHLLQHTSGIPGTNCEGGGDDLDAVLPSFLQSGPAHKPGTRWEYWNQGYAILSEIIARAAGKPYTDYCKSALFGPAGMKSTVFTGDPAPKGAAVATGQSSRGEPRSALEHPYGSYGFQYRGMGGVVTNVWDLWRLDRALAGDKVLGKPAKSEMFKPGLEDYAIGWFVRKNQQGRLVQSHTGSVRGFLSDIRRYPEEEGCVFVLCNRDDAPVEYVAQAVEEILFGESRTIQSPPKALDSTMVKDLVGEYADPKGTRLFVSSDGKVTRVLIDWAGDEYPSSRAILGKDSSGDLVLYEWSTSLKIRIERNGQDKGRVKSLSIEGHAYKRTE